MEKYVIGFVMLMFLMSLGAFSLGCIVGWKAAHRSMLEYMADCQKPDIDGFNMRCEVNR